MARVLLAFMLFAGVEAFGGVTPACEGAAFTPSLDCTTSGETCEGAGITGVCLPDLGGKFACACCRDGPDLALFGSTPEIILPHCPL